MSVGAVAAFAITHHTGNPWLGVLAGAAAGALMSLLFGFLTLTLLANQVASGLALSIFGVGLSAFIGKSYESASLPAVPPLRDSVPRRHSVDRPCAVQPSGDRLCVVAAVRRGRLVPAQEPRRAHTARGRRVARVGALDRIRRDPDPLSGDRLRRGDGRGGRSVSVRVLYAAVGRGHGGGPRLDRAGARGLRDVAAAARAGRRVPVRRRDDFAVVRPGVRAATRRAAAVPVVAPLLGDHHRAGDHLARHQQDPAQFAGIAGTTLSAGG